MRWPSDGNRGVRVVRWKARRGGFTSGLWGRGGTTRTGRIVRFIATGAGMMRIMMRIPGVWRLVSRKGLFGRQGFNRFILQTISRSRCDGIRVWNGWTGIRVRRTRMRRNIRSVRVDANCWGTSKSGRNEYSMRGRGESGKFVSTWTQTRLHWSDGTAAARRRTSAVVLLYFYSAAVAISKR